MCGEAGERIRALLVAGEGSPVVEEFGDILCGRWYMDACASGDRAAADGHLIAALEALLEWASAKGLLPGRVGEAAAHASA